MAKLYHDFSRFPYGAGIDFVMVILVMFLSCVHGGFFVHLVMRVPGLDLSAPPCLTALFEA